MKQSTALFVIHLICVLYCIVYIAICNKYLIIRWLIIICILSLILTQLVGDAIHYPIFYLLPYLRHYNPWFVYFPTAFLERMHLLIATIQSGL